MVFVTFIMLTDFCLYIYLQAIKNYWEKYKGLILHLRYFHVPIHIHSIYTQVFNHPPILVNGKHLFGSVIISAVTCTQEVTESQKIVFYFIMKLLFINSFNGTIKECE